MQKKHTRSTKAYSIIIAVMMVSFLLVLCSWVLQWVLSEMQDSRGRQEYLKASAAAEGALELGLFAVKQHGYGFDQASVNIDALGRDKNSATMEYSFRSKTQLIESELAPFDTVLIPLYWINDTGIQSISWDFIQFIASQDLAWNIIGSSGLWASWKGNFTHSTSSKIKNINGSYTQQDLKTFLWLNPGSYIQVYNSSTTSENFRLELAGWDYVTYPTVYILARWSIGRYHQNLDAKLNNTDFLRILRYSIFSN